MSTETPRTDALTGKDGRAEFSRLTHRSHYVSADPPTDRQAEWLPGRAPSFLPAGQEIAVRLRRAAQIDGVVLLSDGSPARDAHVTFIAGSTHGSEQADASGRFRLRVDADLPFPWRLTAFLAHDWPRTEVSVDLVASPSGDVALRFPDTIRR